MPVSMLVSGERRLEGENYLSEGFRLRQAFELLTDCSELSEFAQVWQPGRLKGIQVSSNRGTPFLAATQIFDRKPTSRKWLALEKTVAASERFVNSGTILVTCSGAVGRAVIATDAISEKIISHDLLRVDAINEEHWGWLYAILRSEQYLKMMTSARYGHIIKHLEVPHVASLPVPHPVAATAIHYYQKAKEILDLRNEGIALQNQAEELFARRLGAGPESTDPTFIVRATDLTAGRRRLEANYYAPQATDLLRIFQNRGRRVERVEGVTNGVWWMPRFKRYYGPNGIPYLSADELFTVNPLENKYILVKPNDGHERYFVEPGWILMACSGQIYGLNGSATLATPYHEQTFFSHDLIRIIPDTDKIRPGYLLTALTHPQFGRPLLIRLAYGTSIPHLDPKDVAAFPLVRLSVDHEHEIADLAERAFEAQAAADVCERELRVSATNEIARFLSQ